MKAAKNIEGLVVAVRGLMLLVVFAAIVFMVTAMTQEMVREYISRRSYPMGREETDQKELTEEQKRDKILRSARREWQTDGTVHLVLVKFNSQGRNFDYRLGRWVESEIEVEVYDTEANLLWSGLEKESPFSYLSGPERYYDRWHGFYFTGAEFLIDFSRSFVVPVVSAEKIKVENWRYVPSGEYFAGYNGKTGTIGYLGGDGFCSEKGKVRDLGRFNEKVNVWVPRDSYSPRLLWQTDKVLWQIDFERRRAEKLYESKSEIESVRFFGWRGLNEKDVSLRGAIVVNEPQRYHLIIDNPRETIAIDIPDEYSQVRHSVNILRDGDDFYVEVSGLKGAPVDKNDRAALLKWIEETRGKPTERWEVLYRLGGERELEFLARNDWTRPADVIGERQDPWERVEEFKKYTTAAAPAFFGPMSKWRTEAKYKYRNDYKNFFIRGLDEILIYTAPTNMLYCLVLSLLSACAAAYHGWGRRRSAAGLIGWIVFVGVFNVAGLLTYLAMNHRRVLKCSACGKKRHLIGDTCIRCGGGLPAPERRQTDLVFAG